MAAMFGAIALYAFKRRTPMHFWAGTVVKPEEIRDVQAYNRANGIMWSVYAACVMASCLLAPLHFTAGFYALFTVIVLGLPVLIVAYKRIYNKYKSVDAKARPNCEDKKPKTAIGNNGVAISIIMSIVILLAVSPIIIIGMSDSGITVTGKMLKISGAYGVTVALSNIAEVTLIEQSIREIGGGRVYRSNGFGAGGTVKGNCSGSLGDILVFVKTKSAPTLKITRRGAKDIYISFSDGKKTRALYAEIMAAATL
jgi:hypothetical protein